MHMHASVYVANVTVIYNNHYNNTYNYSSIKLQRPLHVHSYCGFQIHCVNMLTGWFDYDCNQHSPIILVLFQLVHAGLM